MIDSTNQIPLLIRHKHGVRRANLKPDDMKIRRVLLEDGDFVALLGGGNRFDRLVDKRVLLERAVAVHLTES